MGYQSGWSWEQHSVCGDDPVVQQSSHAAVYMLLLSLCFPHIYAFILTTSTVTILCTCPIMHDKLIHLLLFALQWESHRSHAHHWPVRRLQWRNLFFLPEHMANSSACAKTRYLSCSLFERLSWPLLWRTQSSAPVQLPQLIVRHESGCLAIWTIGKVSVHSYLVLVQHVEIARGLACR